MQMHIIHKMSNAFDIALYDWHFISSHWLLINIYAYWAHITSMKDELNYDDKQYCSYNNNYSNVIV